MSTTEETLLGGKDNTGSGDGNVDAQKAAADKAAADKAAADKAAADQAAADAANKAIVYNIKLGEKTLLSQADVDETLEYAKAQKLTNEQATAVLQQREAAAAAYNTRSQQAFTQTAKQWAEDVKSDKDLGGANYDATLASVKVAMDRFAPEGSKLRTILNETGYGNHPEMVRFVAAIGKAMAEDGGIRKGAGGGTGAAAKTVEEVLYGNAT